MLTDKLSILALSAYHGGPRQTFLEGLLAHSRHRYTVLTLPPRTWHWRLKGSALHFAAETARLKRRQFDLILTDDLVDAARLRALLPADLRATPIVQYLHADALSLDLKTNPRDEPLALAQFFSILAAERALVASDFHRRELLADAKRLIATFPDAAPVDLLDRLEARVAVLPPAIDVEAIRSAPPRPKPPGAPVILWNHPWIDEQNPAAFFETLAHLEQEGAEFRLIIVGAAARKYPEPFNDARRRFARRLLRFGYLPGRDQYLAAIRAADIVVSTARREWFPLGVVEAAIAGAWPLVGCDLANPEVFADALSAHGYRNPVDLRRKLARLLSQADLRTAALATGTVLAQRYGWHAATPRFDAVFQDAVALNSRPA